MGYEKLPIESVYDFIREEGKVKRELIDDPNFLTNALQNPVFENAVVGVGSVYCLKLQTVFIYPSHQFENTLYTHSSIARKIVENALSMTGRKRYPRSEDIDSESLRKPPIYCYPCEGDLIYIDLRSAYWQIYQRMPLYCRQTRGRWNNAPPYLSDYLPLDLRQYKLIRNAIGGLWRSTVSTRIKNGKLVRKEQFFPTTSFDAWQLLQEHLHAIATVAIGLGAYYVNNDGYIFRTRSYWQEFTDFLDENGLEWEIKAMGAGFVAGVGMYSIGELQTKRIANGKKIDKVDRCSLDVLTLRRSFFSRGTNNDFGL